MKHLLTTALLIAIAAPVHAGGPVIAEDAAEAAPVRHMSPGEKIALGLTFLLAIGILSGGGGGSSNCHGSDEPPTDGGC